MNPDKAAQEVMDSLADMFEGSGNFVYRFTPSVKVGRRYLVVEKDGLIYNFEVNVGLKERSEK